jgi:hypothetical protein
MAFATAQELQGSTHNVERSAMKAHILAFSLLFAAVPGLAAMLFT